MPFRPHRLKELREAKGWSQEELCKRAGLSQSVIAKSERGRNSPGSDVLDKLAEALDCTIDYLLGRGPDYENVARAAARMAFDVFAFRMPLAKEHEERCRRALQHVDAPRTAKGWRSFAEMLNLAAGQSLAEISDRDDTHPAKPRPMAVGRRHNYARNQ
jgi:transcriptional regulator with XRE-family HTH domain